MSLGSIAPVIGFIDIDSFECQLWQRDYPKFWGRPCVVTNQSGRILSVTNEAKKFGVSRTTTPFLYQALEVCPKLHAFKKPNMFGKPDSKKTREGTWEVLDCIKDFCSRFSEDIIIEMASSDEFYLDLSSEITRRMNKILQDKNFYVNIPFNTVHERFNGSSHGPFDYRLKRRVRNTYYKHIRDEEDRLVLASVFMSDLCNFLFKKTYLSASAGVGNSKLLAKVGCGVNRPRNVTVFHSGAFPKLSKSIPIKNIPGLGGIAGEELMKAFNIKQVSELRKICLSRLESHCDAYFDPPYPDIAKRIFSSARGNDDQPVVRKLMKTGIVVNKPCGDIQSMRRLRQDVWNLSCEILSRLKEEKIRHKRITNQVRFGFTCEAEDGVNTIIDVTLDSPVKELFNQGMEFIKKQPNFTEVAFKIVELKFVVNEFLPMNSVDGLSVALRKLFNMVPKNSLPVNARPLQVTPRQNSKQGRPLQLTSLQDVLQQLISKQKLPQEIMFQQNLPQQHVSLQDLPMQLTSHQDEPDLIPQQALPKEIILPLRFTNLKHIGTFQSRLNENHLTQNVRLPELIPLDQLFGLIGYNLESGYESQSPRLFDYSSYTDLKHSAFIKWLKDVKFMQKVKDGKFKKPDFIGFSARFSSPMKSPAVKQFGDWELYACNIDGIIYLWEERKAQFEDTRQTYHGTSFEKLAVKKKKGKRGSRYEMAYVVTELTLDQHQILNVSNVDAVDAEGDWVEISTWKLSHDNALFAKTLKAWAECCLHGSSKHVIGFRNDAGIVEDIEIKTVEDLANDLGDEDTSKCMHFENKLLSYIKSQLPESNSKVVKKFSWTCGNRNVSCGEVQQQGIPNLVLSRLYSSYLNSIAPPKARENSKAKNTNSKKRYNGKKKNTYYNSKHSKQN